MTAESRSAFATRWSVATAALVAPELVSTLGLGFRELLTGTERLQAFMVVLLASAAATAVAVAMGTGIEGWFRRQTDPRRPALVTFGLSAMVCAPFFWALTDGRRVRELATRPLIVVLVACVFSLVVTAIVRRVRRGPSRALAAFFGVSVLAVQLVDTFVLPRLYPAFHWLLALLAVFSACLAGALAPGTRWPLPIRRFLPYAPYKAAVLVVLAGPVAYVVSRAPNTSFVVERHASVSGKLVTAVSSFGRARRTAPSTSHAAVSATLPGIDLRDRDILLITVDALRADRLRAYGGTGLTPNMDALADESAVFEHAYTTTPHTSYALASLLTGKYLRPVLELPNAPREHTALPDRIRRYGYRTAAFYPPAIFFVDADRFRALEEQGFGFEYRKQMYAPAADRVIQVETYLGETAPGRPVFVWVHLFEPHEPYDPPAEFRDAREGQGDEALYDGEVRAADAAIGALVRSFRARRPGATVILTADHGEEFGDHGGRYHGSTLYEEQVHVPLLWSSPGVVSPHRISAPVEHVDIASTLLGALGVPRDVRMRGEDLGALLASRTEAGPTYAFADIADERMVCDGRWKAICDGASPRCELYDLRADPRERRNVAGVNASEVTRLRSALAEFVASIPRIEAMSMGDERGWPDALARAGLGDSTVAPELEPLLASERAEVRAAAARELAHLHYASAVRVLEMLATNDLDATVRDEAVIASVALGGTAHLARAREIAVRDDEPALRAALALAEHSDATGSPRLGVCVSDAALDETRRRACVLALGRVRARGQLAPLIAALDDVRLRTDVANALGEIGDRAAANSMAQALERERYVPPRLALARGLQRLGDRRYEALTRRYLGMGSGMPGGVGLLLDGHRIAAPMATQGDLRMASVEGMRCDASGCVPTGASALLPLWASQTRRVVLRVHATEGARLVVHVHVAGEAPRDVSFGPLVEGDSEVAFVAHARESFRVSTEGDARLVAYVLVPEMAEIPPPAAEAWDAGVDDANTPSP